jgi:hypothetical protein
MKSNFQINESKSPMVYWLNAEDVQTIAMDKLQRKLTQEEIAKLVEPINKNIDWAEAIGLAIDEYL